jgi:pimeloyl-ACP methyl ester carboxylesterase
MQRIITVLLVLFAVGLPLQARRLSSPAGVRVAVQGIDGNWEGTIAIGPRKLRLVLKVSRSPEGALQASMDSLDQPGSMGLKVDTISIKDGAIHFEMRDIAAVYDGTMNRDGSEMSGTFAQRGNDFALILRKVGVELSTAPVKRGSLEFKPCNRATLTSDALCGKYEVFEDRDAKAGRKIALNIIMLPAASARPAADATFYLVGGPGAGATSAATAPFMSRLRKEHDVVLVDQRGTGASNPLACKLHGDQSDIQSFFNDLFPVEKVRACRAELEKIANLKLYTTSIAMADLDEVRAALGYDRINLYGASYGSTAALVYLREHPDHIRTVTVFGVAPPDMKLPLSFAKGVQHATDRVFDDCAADAACHAAFPRSREEFESILKKFEKGPIEVTSTNPYTGAEQKLLVSRDGFVDAVRLLLYVPNAMSAMPLLIHLGAQGDLGPVFSTAFQVGYQQAAQTSLGMQLSVVCSEDVPFITAEDSRRESAGTFYRDTRVRPVQKACAEGPRENVPASFLEPVKGNAPVLLISGELDPVTPPWLAANAARNLSNSRHLIIHYATHDSYPCVHTLAAEFIDKASMQGLDMSCAEKIRRPPFLTSAR